MWWLYLQNCQLVDLAYLPQLKELRVEDNAIQTLRGFKHQPHLEKAPPPTASQLD